MIHEMEGLVLDNEEEVGMFLRFFTSHKGEGYFVCFIWHQLNTEGQYEIQRHSLVLNTQSTSEFMEWWKSLNEIARQDNNVSSHPVLVAVLPATHEFIPVMTSILDLVPDGDVTLKEEESALALRLSRMEG